MFLRLLGTHTQFLTGLDFLTINSPEESRFLKILRGRPITLFLLMNLDLA
jgi:hypothetical protein